MEIFWALLKRFNRKASSLQFPGVLVGTLLSYLGTSSKVGFTQQDFEGIKIVHDHLVKSKKNER